MAYQNVSRIIDFQMPRLVKILISVLLLSSLTYLFGWSSVFTVKKVEYSGISNSNQISAVERRVGDLTGTKLARIEPRQIANTINSLSWVNGADVSRNWFSGSVSISVQPRTAIGAFGTSYIDASGTIFDPIVPPVDVPRVSAPTPDIGLEAIKLFTSLPQDFRANIESMSARSGSDFSMILQVPARQVTLRFGSADDVALKVKVFNALMALKENKKVSAIDVSAPHAPIVK
uniref:cell division protein FtsQ/DivIB n=1 Tax=Candidatus Planktophila sp. TaxID=2175601 RepID=UPI00404A7280